MKLKGRAWKCKYKTGNEHHKRCHGVNDKMMTLCGKNIIGAYFYDEESNDEITCPECGKVLEESNRK